jgi:hypothetical protein
VKDLADLCLLHDKEETNSPKPPPEPLLNCAS